MTLHEVLAASSANAAAWTGAIGTCAVGLIAAWIALMQYRHNKFRPAVWAFHDAERRIMVRIINEGAGAGLVTDVNLLSPKHLKTGATEFYQWELEGQASAERPLPFTLTGNSSAQLFLIPAETAQFDGLRVRVDYSTGKDSGCQAIVKTDGRLFGSTYISGVTPKNGDAASTAH